VTNVEPEIPLIPSNALSGLRIGMSVSDSADLSRLGLTPMHCDLAIAELTRAIILAGGTIIYGGRLDPPGFTTIMLKEIRRYREDREALIICVPHSEHRHHSAEELAGYERELTSSATLTLLDSTGTPVTPQKRPDSSTDDQAALTAMRRYVTRIADARVLVGGKLDKFRGTSPGIIEEAQFALQAEQPLYVAGGFGGAAAAVASVLLTDTAWYPPDFPFEVVGHHSALSALAETAKANPIVDNGLTAARQQQLAATHRPGDIASIVVSGLAHVASRRSQTQTLTNDNDH
jgi:SLOG cluster2